MANQKKLPLGTFAALRRKKLGLAQKDMGSAMGYTPQAISKFELENSNLPLIVLPKLCETLQISLEGLLNREVDAPTLERPNIPFDADIFSINISYLRTQKGISRKQEAKAFGIGERSIVNYEKGCAIPSISFYESMLSFYQCDPYALLAEDLTGATQRKAKLARKRKFIFAMAGGGTLAILAAIVLPITLMGTNQSPAVRKRRAPNPPEVVETTETGEPEDVTPSTDTSIPDVEMNLAYPIIDNADWKF